MVRSPSIPSEYILQDTGGHLFRLDTKKRSVDKILSFHSGAVSAAGFSPTCHSLVSLGRDGTLRLYDYLNKKVLLREKYSSGGTALCFLPDVNQIPYHILNLFTLFNVMV